MATALTATPRVGDKVGVDLDKYPGVWTVTKVNPVNISLVSDSGRKLRCHPSFLVEAPSSDEPVTGRPYVPRDFFDAGQLVRLLHHRPGNPLAAANQLFVVLVDKGERVNIAKLGGDNGRYIRALSSSLVKVDPNEVLK